MIWRLALRNVLRQKRRTLLTLLVLAAGYMALALSGGFMAQSFRGLADAAIRGGLGHAQVLDPRSLDGDEAHSLEFCLPDGEALAGRLRRDPAVLEVLPRIQFMGLVSAGSRSVAFLGTGVDPVRVAAHMAGPEQVKEALGVEGGRGGRWLSGEPTAREVVLGIGLARSLQVRVGDSVTLMATTRAGALNAVDVDVVGLADLGMKEANDRFLTVGMGSTEALLQAEGARSRLTLLLRRPGDLERTLPGLRAAAGGAQVKPWHELAAFYRQVKMLYAAIFGFMGLVLGFVVLLATANTLLMSVLERFREFGTLRALGLQPRRLWALVQAEACLLGLAGSATGLLATLLLRA